MKNSGPPVLTSRLPFRPYGRPERFCRLLLIAFSVLILTVGSTSMAASQSSSNSTGDIPVGERPVMGNQVFVIPATEIPRLQDDALRGSGAAAYKLAQFYNMVALDFKDGLYWMTIAAENGDIKGVYGLGYLLRFSKDPQSKIRARYWLGKAEQEGQEPIKTLAAGLLRELDNEQNATPK